MSYPHPYGQGYAPVSSKSGILVVALLTTLAAAIGIAAFFVLTYLEDPSLSYTYFEFIDEVDSLQIDAIIIGASLLVSPLCAWLIYAMPTSVMATLLRIVFVLAGIAAGVIAVLSIYVAGIEDGPSFMDIVNASPDVNWGMGAWTILGSSILVFLLSIAMIFVVASYRKAVRRFEGHGMTADPRQQYPDPGYRR